jgi:hypothetical protein
MTIEREPPYARRDRESKRRLLEAAETKLVGGIGTAIGIGIGGGIVTLAVGGLVWIKAAGLALMAWVMSHRDGG